MTTSVVELAYLCSHTISGTYGNNAWFTLTALTLSKWEKYFPLFDGRPIVLT